MNPFTKIPVELTAAEWETVLSIMLKQTALPGEQWINLFFSIRQQRDAALKPPQLAAVPDLPAADQGD